MTKKFYFDEIGEAEKIIKNGFTNGVARFNEIERVAKYFRQCLGYGKKKLKDKLISFCEENDKNFNAVIGRKTINACVRDAMKYGFRNVHPIPITNKEIELIQSIKDFKRQKLYFITLVFAKALKFSTTRIEKGVGKPRSIGYFISNDLWDEIIKRSKVKISKDKYNYFLHDLYLLGLVEPTYHDTTNLVIKEEDYPVILVGENDNSFENMIDLYVDYCGGELFYCEDCGKKIEKTGKNQKRCSDCQNEYYKIGKNY